LSCDTPKGRLLSALERFGRIESLSGMVLLAGALVALAWANSRYGAVYTDLWETPIGLSLGDYRVTQTLHFLVNDGLMTVFFLVVGAEIRQEIHDGALATLQQALLPLGAALGGVMAPALIYLALHHGGAASQGWAIPTATDIAFAVGVLALLGRSLPGGIRVLLLALAIIDDIVAILIIAVFYAGSLDASGLAIVLGGLALLLGMQRLRIDVAALYLLPGAIVWYGLLKTGVHPTLAGVILGLATPVRPLRSGAIAPVRRVQEGLHRWVAFGIMPLFALANAGVELAGADLDQELSGRIFLAVALALVLGKPLGVIAACGLLVKTRLCRLPGGVGWSGVTLVGLLAGIGFTMSIFISALAFSDRQSLAAAKLGVLCGSVIAALVGLSWGWLLLRRRRAGPLAR
jgi:NhaA family Na+:H+ antiporter